MALFNAVIQESLSCGVLEINKKNTIKPLLLEVVANVLLSKRVTLEPHLAKVINFDFSKTLDKSFKKDELSILPCSQGEGTLNTDDAKLILVIFLGWFTHLQNIKSRGLA